jgi:membrane protease YdiL (CAAX protease family)
MNHSASMTRPRIRYLGLAIALLGGPALVAAFRAATGENHSDAQILCRELMLFALAGFLLWLVRERERLPLSSIGFRRERVARSVLVGFAWGVAMLALTVGLYVVFQQVGVKLGSESANAFHPSLGVVALVTLRAGVVEEIFYRGYAIERLETLTGKRWVAILLPLACFAAAHYRQGIGGIAAAAVLGGVLTFVYLKRRDIVTNITAHTSADFVLNVVLPLVGGG